MKFDVQMGFERRLWNGANLGFVLEIKNVLDEKYQLVSDYPLPGREWAFKTVIGMKGE